MKKEEIHVGMAVWAILEKTRIPAEFEVAEERLEGGYLLVPKGAGTYPCIREAKDIFPNRGWARAYLNDYNRMQKEQYRSEIHSIEDLVRFLFTHHVCGCMVCEDGNARAVAKEKAMEFGINLISGGGS